MPRISGVPATPRYTRLRQWLEGRGEIIRLSDESVYNYRNYPDDLKANPENYDIYHIVDESLSIDDEEIKLFLSNH